MAQNESKEAQVLDGELSGSLARRYHHVRRLGEGGQGVVHLVEDRFLSGRPVVVKILRPKADKEWRSAFRHEFEALAGLKHPRLAEVHDFGATADGRVFFTRDYVAGDDLYAATAGADLPRIISYCVEVCRALKPLHGRGLVHGDLKPGNIICTDDGFAHLIDFSFVRASNDDAKRRGTVPYMAPEVIEGKQADARADLYSLGASIFEIVSGAPPFEGTVSEIVQGHLGKERPEPEPRRLGKLEAEEERRFQSLKAIIVRLLSPSPSDRFPDIAELEAALTAVAPDIIAPDPLPDYPLLSQSVGRDQELDRIREAVKARLTPSDHSPLFVVEGELGTGKSAVLRGIKWWAQLGGVALLEARCGGGGLFRPIADIIEQGLVFLEGDEEATQSAMQLLSLVSRPEGKGAHLDGLTKAIAELFVKISRKTCLVITVDDVEQASPETLTVLRGLLASVESGDPLAIIAATDPSFDWRARVGQAEHMVMPVLNREQIAQLMQWFLGSAEPHSVERVFAHTGGNPLFVTTLLSDLAAGAEGTARIEKLGPPLRLERYWRDRVSTLDEPPRSVLEAIAVLARPAAESDVAVVAALDEEKAASALIRLEIDGWLRRAASGWHMSSEPMAREVLSAADPERKRRYHERAISVEPDEAKVLLHAARAGDLARVRAKGTKIASALRRLGALHAAQELLLAMREALEGEEEAAEVSLDLGRVCLARGEFALAETYLTPLIDSEDAALRREALVSLGRLISIKGRLGTAVEYLNRALDISANPSEEARVLSELADVTFKQGHMAETIEFCQTGLSKSPRGHRVRADLHGVLAKAAVKEGRHDDAKSHAEEAEADARLAGDQRSIALAIGILAWVHQRAGNLGKAVAELERAVALNRDFGDLPRLMRDQLVLGDLNLWLENWAEALRYYEQAVRLVRTVDNPVLALNVQNNFGLALTKVGCFERAQLVLGQVEESAAEQEQEEQRLWSLCHQGVLATSRNELDEAIAKFETARTGFQRLGRTAVVCEIELELAGCLLWRNTPGDLAEARRFIEQAAGREREEEGRQFEECLQLQRGTLLVLEDRFEEGIGILDSLCETATEKGPLDFAWRAHLAAAKGFLHKETTFMARRRLRAAEDILLKLSSGLSREHKLAFWQDARRAEVRGLINELSSSSAFPSTQQQAQEAGTGTLDGEAKALYRVLEFNKQLLADHDLPHLLESILDAAIELTGAERGLVLMATDESEEEALEVRAARAMRQSGGNDPHDAFSRSIAESVFLDGEPVITVDAMSDNRFNEFLSIHELKLKSVVCLPVSYRGRSLGVLYLENRLRRGRFGSADLRVLSAFADQVAIAITQTQLISEARQREQELEKARRDLKEAYEKQIEDLSERDSDLKRTRERLERVQKQLDGEGDYHGVIGTSQGMTKVFSLIERVKDLNVPVVFTGESGTGKDLLARVMHEQSALGSGPYVVANCGSIPETLVESTLFGHTQGAFSGADSERPGLLQAADGGTLYLDELGDMSGRMQVDLLRVLQEGTFTPLGSSKTIAVNVRILASSRVPLEKLAEAGALRRDLLYRLQVVTVDIPPLRERKDDILLLARRIIDRESNQFNQPRRTLSGAAGAALISHPWPGNVRELEQMLRRAIAIGEDEGPIQPDELFLSDQPSFLRPAAASAAMAPEREEAVGDEEARIIEALERYKWNRTRAAEELGIPRRTFYRKIDKMGLVKKRKHSR